jgi:hypothetical protein
MKQSLVNQRLSKYTNKMLGFDRYAKKQKNNSPQNSANFLTAFSPTAMSPSDHPPLTEESLKKLQSPAGIPPAPTRENTPRHGSIAASTVSNTTSMNPPIPPSDGYGSIALTRKGSTSTLGLAEPSGKARSVVSDMNSVGTGIGGGVLRGGIRSSLDEPMSNKTKGK